MILFHLVDGTVYKVDLRCFTDQRGFDFSKNVRRVSLLDPSGRRVDLPFASGPITRVWVETVGRDMDVRGERVCYRTRGLLIKATLYYSDGRVVLDIDTSSGF